MLHIYFSRDDEYDKVLTEDNYRICPTAWFDNRGGEDYISGSLEQQIIADIDKGKVLSKYAVEVPYAGVIPVSGLSGTTKTLILANNEDSIYVNSDFIGGNGYKWLYKIAETKELYLHVMSLIPLEFSSPAHIVNDNSVITTKDDFLLKGVLFLYDRSN